ncbi:hypothetical protein F2P81_026177 [Scophthalmus maximus]|uniref:Uncharacterized protein n=1 Tax=Scophthalmus maximus TaxID=52904 RepID=A0A6A4RQB6_SCOMX|nr:hypothetical protein F2P81_026177 [Scophthalmus maximus]
MTATFIYNHALHHRHKDSCSTSGRVQVFFSALTVKVPGDRLCCGKGRQLEPTNQDLGLAKESSSFNLTGLIRFSVRKEVVSTKLLSDAIHIDNAARAPSCQSSGGNKEVWKAFVKSPLLHKTSGEI